MPEAPELYDAIATALADLTRWIFGSGVVAVVITTVLGIALVIKSWIDLGKDAGTAARAVGRVVERIANRLGELTAVRVALSVVLTVVLLSVQVFWLSATWVGGAVLSLVWTELAPGVPWRTLAGYYTLGCAALLVVGWVFGAKDDQPMRFLRITGIVAALPALLLCLPVFLLIAVGDFYAWFVAAFFLGVFTYLTATFAAMFSTLAIRWAWRSTTAPSPKPA
ncbi:MAG TPA: hypothetical protein VFV67_03970 [Actinophytocola sp.]|uniref:hypothetical protein n=1 Tax=Actinophytocola sp. TaxID=1872138 RepID=UPI002DBC719D|nr:hypothetical protein [Actinophytocola sp.]HEU5469784.1 hypothetical protein [Actinophytocola sp.]